MDNISEGLGKVPNVSLSRRRLRTSGEDILEGLNDTENDNDVIPDGGSATKRLRTIQEVTTEESKGSCTDVIYSRNLLDGGAGALPDNENHSRDFLLAVSTMDISTVNRLLDQGYFPSRDDIEFAVGTRTKRSQLIQNILNRMASHIKDRFKSAIHVWVGYRLKKPNRPVFVVLKKTNDTSIVNGYHPPLLSNVSSNTFEIVIRHENDYSAEGREIMYGKECLDKCFSEAEKETINRTISNCSHEMMSKHSNLNMIGACSVRSVKFSKKHSKVDPVSCIVLYVHVKGIIPFEEDPFPRKIDEIPVDVREGGFEYFAGDEIDPLKIGSLIGGRQESGLLTLTGTAGIMVDIRSPIGNNVAMITCAHIFLHDNARTRFLQASDEERENIQRHLQNVKVYHRCPENIFGTVRKIVIHPGDSEDRNDVSVDAALVEITDVRCNPLNGDFPTIPQEPADFLEEFPVGFDSGKTVKSSHLRQNCEVFKYGSKTGATKGCVHSVSSVRCDVPGALQNIMHNQIEVKNSHKEKPFALHGDSGSFVFIPHFGNKRNLRVLGMVVGGASTGTTIITPVEAILKKFGLSESNLKSFRCEDDVDILADAQAKQSLTLSTLETNVDNRITSLEKKVDTRLNALEEKVDTIDTKIERILHYVSDNS